MLSLLLGRRALVHNSVTEIELNIVPWNHLVWTHISLFPQILGQGVHLQNKHLKDHFLLEKHPPIQRQTISAKKVVRSRKNRHLFSQVLIIDNSWAVESKRRWRDLIRNCSPLI